MFFIDHDQPKVLKRQKQSRARADHQLRLALPDHTPDATTFCHGGTRMPLRRFGTKAFLHTCQELFGQRNLRQQNQSLTPGFESRGHCLQVDLRLAGPGDPAQQCGAIGL